jgi:hypothetical protein
MPPFPHTSRLLSTAQGRETARPLGPDFTKADEPENDGDRRLELAFASFDLLGDNRGRKHRRQRERVHDVAAGVVRF